MKFLKTFLIAWIAWLGIIAIVSLIVYSIWLLSFYIEQPFLFIGIAMLVSGIIALTFALEVRLNQQLSNELNKQKDVDS